MLQTRLLPIAAAAAVGAVLGRVLIFGAWPASAGDWIGVLLQGLLTGAACFLILWFIARRRQS
jgi:hypothetical protein